MLTRIEVRTRQGTMLNLPLEDVDNGLIVDEIEGLDPVKATLVSSSSAQADGEQYHSSKREKRNLKLKLALEPDYITTSVKSLRQRLYTFLMPKTESTLRFHDSDGTYVDIQARVEDFKSPLFTKDPQVDISLIAFDPDFIDPNPVTKSGMSTPVVDAFTEIDYKGSVNAGILFKLSVNRDISSFVLVQQAPDQTTRELEFVATLLANDVVTISTIPGAKGATLTRANNVTSILNGVSPQSNWIALEQGINKFRVAIAGTGIPWEVQYVTRYGGL